MGHLGHHEFFFSKETARLKRKTTGGGGGGGVTVSLKKISWKMNEDTFLRGHSRHELEIFLWI